MSARKRNAFRGFVADIGGMAFIQFLSLLVIPFYLRYISFADYGSWLVIMSVIGWIGLADFGIGFAVTRFFIRSFSKEDEKGAEINAITNTSLLLFTGIAVIFLSAGLFLMRPFASWFHIADVRTGDFFLAFGIVLINSAISLPFSVFSAVLEARQKIALNRNIQTVNLAIQLLTSVVCVLWYKSIVGLAVSLLPATLVSSVLLFYYAGKEINFSFSRKHFNKKVTKELFSFGGYFQAGRTANLVATSTDQLFIASYISVAQVPVYSFTAKVPVLFCNSIASKIAAALFSGLSQVFDQGDQPLFKKTFRKLFDIIVRMAFFASIMIFFLNEMFVDFWVGSKSFGGWKLNLIFVYWVFFETIIRGTGLVIQVYGNMKIWALFAVLEAIANIGLSLFFLHIQWGIVGLALATAVARTFTIGIYWVWFVRNESLIRIRELIATMARSVILNIPLVLILFSLTRFVRWNQVLPELIIYSIIGLSIHVLCYDWHILRKAIIQRSFKVLYHAYLGNQG